MPSEKIVEGILYPALSCNLTSPSKLGVGIGGLCLALFLDERCRTLHQHQHHKQIYVLGYHHFLMLESEREREREQKKKTRQILSLTIDSITCL